MLVYWILWLASVAAGANAAVAARQKNWHSMWGWVVASASLVATNINLL